MDRLVTSYTCRDTGCITDAETRGQKAEERREAARSCDNGQRQDIP